MCANLAAWCTLISISLIRLEHFCYVGANFRRRQTIRIGLLLWNNGPGHTLDLCIEPRIHLIIFRTSILIYRCNAEISVTPINLLILILSQVSVKDGIRWLGRTVWNEATAVFDHVVVSTRAVSPISESGCLFARSRKFLHWSSIHLTWCMWWVITRGRRYIFIAAWF